MNRRTRPLLVLLLVVAAVAAVVPLGTPAVGGSAPDVHVTVDGTAVSAGETYTTRTDVPITVNASVGADASNDTRLDLVVVRVDGSPHRTFDVNATSVSRTVTPPLHYADNEVKVVVTDSTGVATSLAFTVRQDTRAPWVNLTSPYRTDPGALIPDGEVNRSVVTLAGRIQELSTTTRLSITYTHENSSHHGAIDLRRPGDEFSRRITLGHGANTVRILTADDLDNRILYKFEITVNDTSAPAIGLEPPPNATNTSTVTLRGTITDAVWVESATITVNATDANASETRQLVPERDYEPSTERRSVSFETEVDLEAGRNEVSINATDPFGHNETTTVAITYTPPEEPPYVLPTVRLNGSATRFTGGRTLLVAGSVTGRNLTHVAVEATAPDGDRTVGYALVHTGTPRSRVSLEHAVRTRGNVTRITVRAVDERGGQRERVLYVNASHNGTFVGADGVAEASTPTTRTARAPRAGTPPTPRTVVRSPGPSPTPAVATAVRTAVVTETQVRTEVVTVRVTGTPADNRSGLGGVGLPGFALPAAAAGAVLVAGAGLFLGYRYRRDGGGSGEPAPEDEEPASGG